MVEARSNNRIDNIDGKIQVLLRDLVLINKLLECLDRPQVDDLAEGRRIISAELMASPEKQAHIMDVLKAIMDSCAEEAKRPQRYDISSQVDGMNSQDSEENLNGSIDVPPTRFPMQRPLINVKEEFAARGDGGMYRSMSLQDENYGSNALDGVGNTGAINQSSDGHFRVEQPLQAIAEEEEFKRSESGNSVSDAHDRPILLRQEGLPLVGDQKRPQVQQAAAVNQEARVEQVAAEDLAQGIIEEQAPAQIVEEQQMPLANLPPAQPQLPAERAANKIAVDEHAGEQQDEVLSNMSYDSAMHEQPKTEVKWSELEVAAHRNTFRKVEAKQKKYKTSR